MMSLALQLISPITLSSMDQLTFPFHYVVSQVAWMNGVGHKSASVFRSDVPGCDASHGASLPPHLLLFPS